ncbi:RRA3 [Symbiodinium natans]|uniref:RRA3 protein n=1 Tax=Symbiodinium natans TaxID=878477 RepID=A0A812K060_9DINO|nr:RRA3 [Symbiodinium natans]
MVSSCRLCAAAALILRTAGDLRFPDYVPGFAESEACLPKVSQAQPVFSTTELDSKLQQVADASGIVVFSVFVNTGDMTEESRFAAQLEHWMCRTRSVFGRDFLVFVDSERSRQRWEGDYGITAFFSRSWIQEVFTGPSKGEIHDSNYWRWAAMESILRAGYTSLYVDTDILWIQDARPHLEALQTDVDFFGSCDAYDGRNGSIRWFRDGALNMDHLREEARLHDGESVCCQGELVPVNAGVIFMRPSSAAISAVQRFRERIFSGPCWGQAAMHWSLFELCGSKLSCEMLDPLLFASASPLRSALRKDPQTASRARPALIHLDVSAKGKATQYFEGFFGTPPACAKYGRGKASEL